MILEKPWLISAVVLFSSFGEASEYYLAYKGGMDQRLDATF